MFRWVGLVAKSVAQKNWATGVFSPDIAKAQTLKKFPAAIVKASSLQGMI
jgi:hypothetical protein